MKKSTIHAVDEFVKLVGGSSWEAIKSRCGGKWAGTYDYGICIDRKANVWVSNGMTGFETRIVEWCGYIRSFNTNKEKYLAIVKARVVKDNEKGAAEGLYPVTVLDIGIISPETSDGYFFFLPYVLIEVNSTRYKFTETGLGAFLRDNVENWLAEDNAPLWTAGGVKNPDFAFNGVRFDSQDGMYRIR